MADSTPSPQALDTQSVLPTAQFAPRNATGADMGAQIGQALDSAGDQLRNFADYYQRDQDRLENFNLETSFTDFTSKQQAALLEGSQNIQAGGAGFTKKSTEAFDAASSEWISKNVPVGKQPEWKAKLAQTRAQFSTGALKLELTERDSYYKNTVATKLNEFANGIGIAPATYDNYRKMGEAFIDASGMSPADKDVARKRWAGESADVLAQSLIVKDPKGFKAAIEKGDPRFADLDAGKVRSLVGAADREVRQRTLEAKQAANLDNANFTNDLLLRIHDGKAGQADIDNARATGRLKDASDVFRAESVLKNYNENVGSADFVNTALGIKNYPFNPYDPMQKKGVNSAVKAAGGSPMAAFNIWQKTGILGDAGAVALRGGLVSTDAARVGASANIAGNMIARNPNAFAGVEGREDIERGALLYNHYTSDLGYDAQTAAQKVAQQNDPSYQSKIKISEPDVMAFRKTLNKTANPVAGLVNSKNTWGGMFGGNISASSVSGAMRQSIASDFGEIATDYYQKTGDAKAAQAYAQQKVSSLYGVSNGQLMKFPPEKIYPAMGDGKPGYTYIYAQAAADVNHHLNSVDLPASGKVLSGTLHLDPKLAPKMAGNIRPFAPGEFIERPGVGWSSEISTTVQDPRLAGGKPTTVPTLWLINGKPVQVSEDDAVDLAAKSGLQFKGYGSMKEADAAAAAREATWQKVGREGASKVAPLYDTKIQQKTIDPKDIVLTPLPVATAEAWKNGTRVPYQIHYYQDIDGQRVLQTLPSKAFVADPGIEAKRVTTERSAKFADEKAAHEELDKLRLQYPTAFTPVN